MKIVKFTLILFITIICENAYCQEDTTNVKKVNDQFLRQKINNANDTPKDTIKLFLDDTSCYISLDDKNYFDKFKIYSNYLNNGYVPSYLLSEKLPDGYYCLYNITKKQAKKIKNIEEYIVSSGEFKNGMKESAFYFRFIPDNPKWSKAEIIIYFKDDLVNGAVIERENDKIMCLGEYKMGIKHGFFYFYNGGSPSIVLFENGVKVKDSIFW
jgi:hypothetical protein